MKVKVNRRGVSQMIRTPEAERMVAEIRDSVSRRALSLTGRVDGEPVTMKHYEEPTPMRARAAVVAKHPTVNGRKSARDGLVAALNTERGVS